jgi:hypothetical protein
MDAMVGDLSCGGGIARPRQLRAELCEGNLHCVSGHDQDVAARGPPRGANLHPLLLRFCIQSPVLNGPDDRVNRALCASHQDIWRIARLLGLGSKLLTGYPTGSVSVGVSVSRKLSEQNRSKADENADN